MTSVIEMGTVSARGQIAIPTKMRRALHLSAGQKVLFFMDADQILLKKVNTQTWEELTRPLREAPKKIKEEDVVDLIHELRKKWRKEKK